MGKNAYLLWNKKIGSYMHLHICIAKVYHNDGMPFCVRLYIGVYIGVSVYPVVSTRDH